MKAVLLISYLLIQNPSFILTQRILFKSRVACEVREGSLNLPVTGGRGLVYEYSMNGMELDFIKANCRDIPSGLTR